MSHEFSGCRSLNTHLCILKNEIGESQRRSMRVMDVIPKTDDKSK